MVNFNLVVMASPFVLQSVSNILVVRPRFPRTVGPRFTAHDTAPARAPLERITVGGPSGLPTCAAIVGQTSWEDYDAVSPSGWWVRASRHARGCAHDAGCGPGVRRDQVPR